MTQNTKSFGKPWETLAFMGPIPRHLERAEAVACFRLTTGHDFLGVYLHWLGVAANEAYPLCGHARLDGDHLLQCIRLIRLMTSRKEISEIWDNLDVRMQENHFEILQLWSCFRVVKQENLSIKGETFADPLERKNLSSIQATNGVPKGWVYSAFVKVDFHDVEWPLAWSLSV
ncbi:uncharacterized protein TNCV_3179831 [Trichonephila clavipes]|nr:uncharacterized protein TNCV_3179831 [Trichonephila clavipes]